MDTYSRLIEMMRVQGKAYNDYPLMISDVLTVSPLTIRYNHTDIPSSVAIWCPAEMLTIKNAAGVSTSETGLKECLSSIYQAFTIKPGDRVFAKRVEDEIYILGKAVQA